MQVNLVSITHPSSQDIKSAEDLVVYCARVSNPSNQMSFETAPKLLSYLIRHKHWSPFEMVDMCVEIKTSRAIAAQILRHRSFSFQEFSQRYAKVTDFEDVELRQQGATNRQVGDEVIDPMIRFITHGFEHNKEYASKLVEEHIEASADLYESLINAGVAKESARMILPLTTQTTMYMKGSLRSWIHYLELRCSEHTQKEHRIIANSIKELFKANFPSISEALSF